MAGYAETLRGRSMAANDRGRGKPRRKPKPGRQSPPPESTGREAGFLFKARDMQAVMVIETVDGRTLKGTIEYYDRDMIKLVPAEGPGLFMRKSEIRSIIPEQDDI